MLLTTTRSASHDEAQSTLAPGLPSAPLGQTASPVLTVTPAALLALWGLGQMRPAGRGRGMGGAPEAGPGGVASSADRPGR